MVAEACCLSLDLLYSFKPCTPEPGCCIEGREGVYQYYEVGFTIMSRLKSKLGCKVLNKEVYIAMNSEPACSSTLVNSTTARC